jgi:hypothetical protein
LGRLPVRPNPESGYPRYHTGDIWGCLGFWYSGTWYNSDAITYISHVQQFYAQKVWFTAAFAAVK